MLVRELDNLFSFRVARAAFVLALVPTILAALVVPAIAGVVFIASWAGLWIALARAPGTHARCPHCGRRATAFGATVCPHCTRRLNVP